MPYFDTLMLEKIVLSCSKNVTGKQKNTQKTQNVLLAPRCTKPRCRVSRDAWAGPGDDSDERARYALASSAIDFSSPVIVRSPSVR